MLPRYLKFALKSSVSVAKSAQKKHEMIGWTPQIDCHSLLSTIMQNKKLQIVLCHKRIISSKFKIFKKRKKLCPQNPTDAFNCKHCSSYCWLLKFSLPGPEIFLYQGQKNKRSDVRIINFIWLYPFSWMFSLWLHFFVRLPYFDWKQCNFHHKNAMNSLEEIWLQFLNTNQKKFSKQHKMLHYLYIYFVSAKNFQRLVLVSVFSYHLFIHIKADTKMTPRKENIS